MSLAYRLRSALFVLPLFRSLLQRAFRIVNQVKLILDK